MLNGDYYTLAEAADYIASKTGKKKNDKDVLRDAKNGKIRLCIWFDGTLYKFNRDEGTGKLQSIDDYKFSGYIQIPKKRITPKGGTIQFGSVTIIEVEDEDVWAKNRDPRTLDDSELSDRYFDSQSNCYQPCNLFAELENALIPEQDLNDFIEKIQTADTKNNHHIQESSNQITNWKTNAREIGKRIHNENPKLSVEQIAKKTHSEMIGRKNEGEGGMTGRGDKIPSAETIKRHALAGLKS